MWIKREIYCIYILGLGKSELRVMYLMLPYNSLVLMILLWGLILKTNIEIFTQDVLQNKSQAWSLYDVSLS